MSDDSKNKMEPPEAESKSQCNQRISPEAETVDTADAGKAVSTGERGVAKAVHVDEKSPCNTISAAGVGVHSEVINDENYRPAIDKFSADFRPLVATRFFAVIDTVLKQPAQVVHMLIHAPQKRAIFFLLVTAVLCLGGIGMMMGGFSGGDQLWMVPLKVVLGTALSAVICLPSLYILVCLSGGVQRFGQVSRLLLLALCLSGMLFVGFLPVAWIFSAATDSERFMGCLYMLVWAVGLFFGLRLLNVSLRALNKRSMGAVGLWMVVFILVLLQMSTTLRPLIGEYAPLQLSEKQFFISHWVSLD